MTLHAPVEQACAMAGRSGFHVKTDEPPKDLQFPVAVADDDEPDAPSTPIPLTTVAVPELTHPGESQTNGLAERSIRTLEEQVRTMAAALEAHMNLNIPSAHPLGVAHRACIVRAQQIWPGDLGQNPVCTSP